MSANRFSFLFLISFLVSFTGTFAQNASVSPYSRYGLGDIPFGGFTKNNGMGGIGIGYRTPFNINLLNPASYSSLSLTTYEFGGSASFTKLSTVTLKQNKSDATFSYFTLGFPVIRNTWGAVIGLVPFSDVGYKINDPVTDANAGGVLYSYEGSGGVNRFFIGNSVTLCKNFSAGFNASYLFGSLKRTGRVEFSGSNFLNARFTESTSIGDFSLNYGLQYVADSLPKHVKSDTVKTKIKTDRSLTFGLTFSSPVNISAERNSLGETYTSSGVFINVQDTIINTEGEKGIIKLPLSAGFGLSYKKGNQWLIGADATIQNWKDFTYYGQSDSLRNSMRISVGAQFTPDERAMKSYWQSVQYRFGIFYNQTYLQLNGTKLNELGTSLGLGLPVRKGLAMIHLAAQFGARGTTDNNLIREDFARISFGITFNDRWFIKPKFD